MKQIDELLHAIFDGHKSKLYFDFEDWLEQSRRFQTFALEYKTKIRAKVKNAGPGRIEDLRAELLAAFVLLSSEKLAVEYETYASSKQRGPDFTVTFKTRTRFNVEVRWISSLPISEGPKFGKLMAVLCEKCKQMPPSVPNLLWLSVDDLSETDLLETTTRLRKHAEQKDDSFFVKYRFENSDDFLWRYARLSGIITFSSKSRLWLNPLARHKLEKDLANLLRRLSSPE